MQPVPVLWDGQLVSACSLISQDYQLKMFQALMLALRQLQPLMFPLCGCALILPLDSGAAGCVMWKAVM